MANNTVVNSDVERTERGTERRTMERMERRADRGMAIALMLQAIPWFIWAAPVIIVGGFLLMALWFERGHLETFTDGVLLWASRVLIGAGVVLIGAGAWRCYKLYDKVMLDAANRRVANAGATKAIAGARNAELKNELLEADIALRQQIPNVILGLSQMGVPFRYDAKGNLEVLGQAGQTMVNQYGGADLAQLMGGQQAALPAPAAGELPTNVLYKDIRAQVPAGHVLVGVGRGGIVETVKWAVGALVWIVGMSGTGKTSTTVLRVEERHAAGHRFLGVDPHFFKDDSLTNAIKAYVGSFLKPMAHTPEEAQSVLQYFLNEFYGRKNGSIPKPWTPITLLVDEVGSLMDAIDPIEKEVAEMLRRIARICGQESRNFNMGGIYVSQQATGLAWLRKVALMVIVHQLVMMSERELACNGDKAVMKDMEFWPIGRTFVYGVGFGANGARTTQQPYFKSPEVDDNTPDGDEAIDRSTGSTVVEDSSVVVVEEVAGDDDEQEQAPVPALNGEARKVYDACMELAKQGQRVEARGVATLTGYGKDKANRIMNELATMGYIARRNKAV